MAPSLHLAGSASDARSSRTALPIRVVLADDHDVMRRNLHVILDTHKDVDVVAVSAGFTDVMRRVVSLRPQVLVTELRLPSASSLTAIRELRARVPETEVVVLTMEESPLLAQQAFDAGAVGYVLKERADSELLDAIRHAARGEEYVSTRVEPGLDALRRSVDRDALSPRECEILRLIALGYTSAEIAARLHLSRRTVETHRARVHGKLGLRTRAELVRFALRRGLIGA